MLLITLALEPYGGRRYLGGEGYGVVVFRGSEPVQLHRQRQLRMGLHICKVCQEFLVGRRERHNLTRGNSVIAGPGQYTRVRSANLDLHFTKTAVKVLIGTAVSERVTRTDFGIDSLEAAS